MGKMNLYMQKSLSRFIKMLFFISVVLAETSNNPVTIDPMTNETVAVGRDATLQCVVKHLQDYKVIKD